MNLLRACVVTVLALACAAMVAADDPESPPYLVEVQIAVAEGGVSFEAEAHSVTTDDGGGLTSIGEIETMRVGDLELDLDAAAIWGGHETPPEGSGVELLSSPQLRVPAATKGVIRSGEVVQYLERRDSECLTVHTSTPEASPGIVLSLTANPGPPADDGTRTAVVDFKLRVSTIGGREVVPGINFDVGRPTINTTEVSSRLSARLGHWNLLTRHISRDPAAAARETLFVLVRLTRPGVQEVVGPVGP